MRKRAIQQRKQHKRWLWVFFWATCICLTAYGVNIVLGEVGSGEPWGQAYGIAATAIMVGVIGWAIRRRTMKLASKLRLGSSRTWLYFHIYGGLLFLLLVFMHSGFRIPQGMLTFAVWLLSIWTVVSGLAGLALQKWIPKVLASGLSTEAIYERIPVLIAELKEKAEQLVAGAGEPVQTFFARNLQVSFEKPRRRFIFFWDITGGIKSRMRRFEYLRNFLSNDDTKTLNQLEKLYRTKLEMDAHYTLQQPLRWWLFAHVPTSWVLFSLVIIHIFTVLYY